MKKIFLFLISCVLLNVSARADIGQVFANRFQFIVDSVCQKYQIKGLSAAIYIPGGGVWKGAYGESHAGVPITTDMYLPLGSNTKTFTAAVMLRLQEEGKLSLDDTIGTWIKNQPNIPGDITIRQCLNHTSGLYSYTDNPAMSAALNNDYYKVWQPEDMFQFVDAPLFAPGTKWDYCNTNYLLMGMIIHQVTGLDLKDAYRNYVYTPLKLQHTAMYPDEAWPGTEPHGWYATSATAEVDLQVDFGYSNIAFMSMAGAAGALISTAEDGVLFWSGLMSGKVINQTSLDEMRQTIYINSSNSYGLGVFRMPNVNGHVAYMHGGTCYGYLNENMYDSVTGICITVLSNQDRVNNYGLFNLVVKALHKATLNMPPAAVQTVADNGWDVQLYPNPANGYVEVATAQAGNNSMVLYDVSGRQVLQTALTSKNTRVPLTDIPAGLYIARIYNGPDCVKTTKLQIAH